MKKILDYKGRKKCIKTGKFNPKAYKYLDYCYSCGEPITFMDRLLFNVSHCIIGNYHRYRCKEIKAHKK